MTESEMYVMYIVRIEVLMMKKKEIEYKIQELKYEYIRLQNDLEKLEFVQGKLSPL